MVAYAGPAGNTMRRRDAGWLWGYDGMLLLLQGAIGVVISYLFCFSTHPTVGSNWLIAVFNPLPS